MSFQWKKSKGIHHVCLRVQDPQRTVRFYQDALNAHIIYEWGPKGTDDHGILLDLGGGDILEVFRSEEVLPSGIWQHVAIFSDDIQASFEKAIRCGAIPYHQPEYAEFIASTGDTIKMRYSFVQAPSGEIIELIENCIE